MYALKSLVCAGVVGAGALVGAPQEAEAGGGFSISVGHGGYGNYGYGGYGYGSRYGFGNRIYQPRYYGGYGHGHGHSHGGTRVWHDTSHYDYYPGRYVPHGNHYDYVPGHAVWHNDGHWDHFGHGHYGHHH